MNEWYEVITRGRLGGGRADQHDITVLHKIVRWKGGNAELEADPRHVDKLCLELGFDSSSKGLEGNHPERGKGKSDNRRSWRMTLRKSAGIGPGRLPQITCHKIRWTWNSRVKRFVATCLHPVRATG